MLLPSSPLTKPRPPHSHFADHPPPPAPADALQLALQLGLAPATLLAAMLLPKTADVPSAAAPAAVTTPGAAKSLAPGATSGGGAEAAVQAASPAVCMASQGAFRPTLFGWLVFNAGDVGGDLMGAVAAGVVRGAASDVGGECGAGLCWRLPWLSIDACVPDARSRHPGARPACT